MLQLRATHSTYVIYMSCTFLIRKKIFGWSSKGFFKTNWKGNPWCSIFHAIGSTFSPHPGWFCVTTRIHRCFFSCHRFGNPQLNLQSATWHPGWGVDPSHYSITQFGSHRERLLATPIELGGRGHSATWDTTKSLQFALHLLVAVHQPISWNIWSNVKQLLLSMFRVKSLTSSEKKHVASMVTTLLTLQFSEGWSPLKLKFMYNN